MDSILRWLSTIGNHHPEQFGFIGISRVRQIGGDASYSLFETARAASVDIPWRMRLLMMRGMK
jgi:hypothetical protein